MFWKNIRADAETYVIVSVRSIVVVAICRRVIATIVVIVATTVDTVRAMSEIIPIKNYLYLHGIYTLYDHLIIFLLHQF